MNSLAEEMVQTARSCGMTLSVAESCTGGLLSGSITSVAGASDVFWGGYIVYDNSAKIQMLGVTEDVLKKHGAVSCECVKQMLLGLLEKSPCHIVSAVSGIAGPGGGTQEKPVGTVIIGTAARSGELDVESFLFSGSREQVRTSSVETVLKKMTDLCIETKT